jgi:hypothetical protein
MLHFLFFLNVDGLQNQTLIWCYNIYTKPFFFFFYAYNLIKFINEHYGT